MSPPRYSTPTQRLPSNTSRCVCAPVIDREIGTLHRGTQERFRCVPANAALLVDVEIADAGVVAAIEIVGGGDAGLLRGLRKRFEDLPLQALLFDAPFAARAVPFVRAAVMVFAASEDRQHRVPRPVRIAGDVRPVVVVFALAAHVDHAVDRRAAAEHAAARIRQRAAVQARLGLCLVEPVGAWIADAVQVSDRHVNPVVVVLAAGFEQQDGHVRVFGEPVREHATGRARADDDVVEFAFELSRVLFHRCLLCVSIRVGAVGQSWCFSALLWSHAELDQSWRFSAYSDPMLHRC